MPRRVDLPSVRYQLAGGRNTQFNPESTAGKYLLQADNVDSFDTSLAVSKVYGSSRVSNAAIGAWTSLNYAEAFDLDNNLQRKLYGVAVSGGGFGNLYEIDLDTKAITVLKQNVVAESLSHVVVNNRVYFCSPNNRPFKIDMAGQVSNWGVEAPGSEEFVVEPFNNHSIWTINSTNTKSNSTKTPPEIFTSTASVQVNKTSTSVNLASLTRNNVRWNLSQAGEGTIWLYFFLPAGALSKVPTNAAVVQLTLSSGTAYSETNASRYNWTLGHLQEGWNFLPAVLSSPSTKFGVGANFANVGAARFSVYTNANATTQTGFIFDHFGYFRNGALTGSPNILDPGPIEEATVSYRTTYLSRYGRESNAGPASLPVTVITGTVSLSNIPVSSSPDVIARNLYRDLDNDQTYRYLTTIYDNTTTTFLDNISFDALGTQTPPFAGDIIDNSPPPRLRSVTQWNARTIGINETFPYQLEISRAGNEEAFPFINQRLFDTELQGIAKNFMGTIIYASDSTYLMAGDDPLTAEVRQIHNEVGAVGRRAFTPVKSWTVSLHDDGPYMNYQATTFWYLGDTIRDFWQEQDPEGLKDAFVIHDRRKFRLLFFTKSPGSSTFDKIAVWSYGKMGAVVGDAERRVEATDVTRGAWFTVTTASGINPTCAAIVERQEDVPTLFVGCDNGLVYEFQDESKFSWATNQFVTSSTTTSAGTTGSLIDSSISTPPWTNMIIRFTSGANSGQVRQVLGTLGNIVLFTPSLPTAVASGVTYQIINADAEVPVVMTVETTDMPIGSSATGRGRPRFLTINGEFTNTTTLQCTVECREHANSEVLTSTTFDVTCSGNTDTRMVPIPGKVWGYWARVKITSSGINEHPNLYSCELHFIPGRYLSGPR